MRGKINTGRLGRRQTFGHVVASWKINRGRLGRRQAFGHVVASWKINTAILMVVTVIVFFDNKINAQIPVIETCSQQSSHIIFSDDVVYADVGDGEHYIFEYTNNILRLKGQETERVTNLTVITGVADYYSFRVVYKKFPRVNYFITRKMRVTNIERTRTVPADISIQKKKEKPEGIPKSIVEKERVKPLEEEKKRLPERKQKMGKDRQAELYAKAESLAEKPSLYDHIGTRNGDIRLKVAGIYHDLNHCYIIYSIQNRGAVPYDISYVEFGVREQRRPKKSARSERIIKPVLTARGDLNRVHPKRLNRYVAVFEKLAIPEGKILYMEVVEGGRNFTLDIPYNRLRIKQLK